MLTPQQSARILTLIASVLGGTGYEVILFGSQAGGAVTSYSDIDIAIKAEGPLDLAKWQQLETLFEESDFCEAFDIVDYHRVETSFQKAIDSTGIRLR